MAQALRLGATFDDSNEADLANQRALLAQMRGGDARSNQVAPRAAGNGPSVPATEAVAPQATIDLGPRDAFPDGAVTPEYLQAQRASGSEGASTSNSLANLMAGSSAAQPGAYASKLNGFEPSKMTAEHAAKSPKYAFALIAQDYPDTPEGLAAAAQDPRFAAAGLQYMGGDKIMAPDPDNGGRMGVVDVGKSFGAGGGQGWQWGAEGGAQPAGGYSATSLASGIAGTPPSMSSTLIPTDTDFFQKLMEQIRNGSSGDVLDQTALLQQMR